MKLRWWHDPETQDLVFEGRVSVSDYASLDLDPSELAMLRMPVHKGSDFLLNAEMLFRRAQEQAEAKRKERPLLLTHEGANAES